MSTDLTKARPDNFEGFVKARKKPVVIDVLQVHYQFAVFSKEGLVEGQPGDWLMIGVEGEPYICADSVFQKTYEIEPAEQDQP